jgi:dTDP-4-dehydrorhamnose reductase
LGDVLVFGATSLVGSHYIKHGQSACAAAGRRDPREAGLAVERFVPTDLEDARSLRDALKGSPEPAVVNFAAHTDVDSVERERSDSASSSPGSAWAVNAQAAGSIAESASSAGKFLVHVSTDFVFDGRAGPYAESAPRSPYSSLMSWYGWSKSEGERQVLAACPGAAVLRIAYPFRTDFPPKLDFARWIVERYRGHALPPMFWNQQLTPTWVPDVTAAIDELVRQRTPGIVHVASPEVTSPYEFASELLGRIEGRPVSVAPGRLGAPPIRTGRAPRPERGGLRTDRAVQLGLPLTSWRQGIDRLVEGRGR